MSSSPIDSVDVAESSKERWLSEDDQHSISLASVFGASNSTTCTATEITCEKTLSLFHESFHEESTPYLDEDEPLENFLDHPDLFGSFGDFSLHGNDEDLGDESNCSIQPMTKSQEEEFTVLTQPQTKIMAKGFSWNRAKMVRMLSTRSLMLESESGDDEELSVVHSVSTQSTHQSHDTVRVNVPSDHDPDLATQLSRLSREELTARFYEMQNEVNDHERKRAKPRRHSHSSTKEKKAKSRPSPSSDNKKSSMNQSSRDLDSNKVKVKKERSHRTKRESKKDEVDAAHTKPIM
jgi:hypothetical protein